MRRRPVLLLSLALMLSLAGCQVRSGKGEKRQDDAETASETNAAGPVAEPVLQPWDTAWIVYWDSGQQEELSALSGEVQSVCLFSCLYEEDGDVVIPDGIDALSGLADALSFPTVYLSFTNDVRRSDGSVTQKDAMFLPVLWADSGRIRKTIRGILEAVRAAGANAVEIDFENIGDSGQWGEFEAFLRELLTRAQEEGFPVRAVLGSDTPVEELSLPEGAVYTVMCYNLYGTHSGPGPKADLAFLRKTAQRFSALPDMRYALATGGFEWDSADKVTRSLTQAQAEEIAEQRRREPERDASSMALSFTYRDGLSRYTVWYADAVTLAAWQQEIASVDPDARFDLWRVGGNRFE